MPTASASRRIPAPAEQLWRIVSDPYHLPRWWPRVERVEDVDGGAFTEVMRTRKGKTVRADFDVVHTDEPARTVVWEQRLAGTPFAGVLAFSQTELRVRESAGAVETTSEVTIEMRQELAGEATPRLKVFGGRPLWPTMAQRMVRKAARKMIDEALDGLEAISG
jgi:uncharacterized protein YndB with AHSA1/START domain